MKVIIFGAVGSMAIESSRDFAKTGIYDSLVLADKNVTALEALKAELGKDNISIQEVNVLDYEAVRRAMEENDFFINGVPSNFSDHILKAAVDTATPGIDITGTVEMFEYHEKAKEAGILIVAGVGCTPGITNILVRKASLQLDKTKDVTVAFAAWRPIALSPGLVDFTIWALRPDNDERCYYEDGDFHVAEPFSFAREIEFMPPIGKQMVYCLPHQETRTVPRHMDCERVITLGTYPTEDMELFRYLDKYGFMADTPNADGIVPLDFVNRHLKETPKARTLDVWHYGLVVEVSGIKDGKEVKHRMAASHPGMETWGGTSVYAKFTGIPLSVGAQLLLDGTVTGKGVLPPEACMPPEAFFAELEKRGFLFDYQVEDL